MEETGLELNGDIRSVGRVLERSIAEVFEARPFASASNAFGFVPSAVYTDTHMSLMLVHMAGSHQHKTQERKAQSYVGLGWPSTWSCFVRLPLLSWPRFACHFRESGRRVGG